MLYIQCGLTSTGVYYTMCAQIVEICSVFEVTQGLVLVFQLLFPTRNFIFTMMWWQYLQMRCAYWSFSVV